MSEQKSRKTPPAWLFALGKQGLPERISVGGRAYHQVELFKHDFFAATGLYEADGEGDTANSTGRQLAVLKMQRTYPLGLLPLAWLGRRVARHEIEIYRDLQGIGGVPRLLGTWETTGFLHDYVPGVPLRPDLPLTPAFFAALEELLAAIHAAGVAYVDTNKRENILFGDDGRPWLIDFQISFADRRRWWLPGPMRRWTLRRLQREDWYHFYKHKTRLLPSYCQPEDFVRAQRRSVLIRVHRLVAQPLIRMRRWWLARYKLEKVH